MTQVTGIALCRMGERVNVLRANGPETFKRWLSGGNQGLGEPAVEELLIDWMPPLLTQEEEDRLAGAVFL